MNVSKDTSSRSRWPRRTLLIGLLAAVGIIVIPVGGASAHASLVSSSPTSGAVVGDAPDELVLEFDESVTLDLGGVELTDAAGGAIDIAEADGSGSSKLVVRDLPDLSDGVYVVVWQVSSSDGHPARGAFTFQVGSASGVVDSDGLIASALSDNAASSIVTWLLGVARFVTFAGVTVVLGAVLVHLLSGDGRPRRRARVVWWAAWASAVVGSVSVFVLQGPYLTGDSLGSVFDPGLWVDVAGTRLGRSLLVRLALLVASAVVISRRVDIDAGDGPSVGRRTSRSTIALWVLLSSAIVVTFSFTGHPSAASPAAVSVLADAVHLAAVSLWLGGLAGVLVARRPGEKATRRFSALATVAVPTIVVTGAWQTWNLVGNLGDLTVTTWGRTLLAKLALVVFLVTLGAMSRWLLRAEGPHAIRRLVASELVVGGLVLGLTAGLVATPPTPPPAAQIFSATLAQGSLVADVSLTPGRVGGNEIHVVFSPTGGALQPVQSVEARLRSADLPAIPVVLTDDGPNHYVGAVQIPTAGDWTLDLEVEPQPNQTVLLTTTIPIPD